MGSERISWDARKANLNFAKHGVSFLDGRSALRDPLARIWPDPGHGSGERFLVIGMDVHERLLVVVTEASEDGNIRLISARRATKRERHAYTTGDLGT